MNIYYGKRGSGKTNSLFNEIHDIGEDNCVLVVPTEAGKTVSSIIYRDRFHTNNVPTIISFKEFVENRGKFGGPKRIFIDELGSCLERIAGGNNYIQAVSIDNDSMFDYPLTLLDLKGWIE